MFARVDTHIRDANSRIPRAANIKVLLIGIHGEAGEWLGQLVGHVDAGGACIDTYNMHVTIGVG